MITYDDDDDHAFSLDPRALDLTPSDPVEKRLRTHLLRRKLEIGKSMKSYSNVSVSVLT